MAGTREGERYKNGAEGQNSVDATGAERAGRERKKHFQGMLVCRRALRGCTHAVASHCAGIGCWRSQLAASTCLFAGWRSVLTAASLHHGVPAETSQLAAHGAAGRSVNLAAALKHRCGAHACGVGDGCRGEVA